MARTATRKVDGVKRQGRRVMLNPRRTARRTVAAQGPLTLGELIAAAYDTAAGERLEVLRLVTSPQMARALGRRIVLVD